MGDASAIEWTEATWNPVTGCSHVSAGCEHCYAEALSLRRGWSSKPWTAPNASDNVVLHPMRLEQPASWKRPRRVFVNSMSDLFHERIPVPFLVEVFATMALAPRHIFQVLTKRPGLMWETLRLDYEDEVRLLAAARARLGGLDFDELGWAWPLPNVWLGVSIEQDRWCERAAILRRTPAAVRFISAEPLLEPLPSLDLGGIDWLITGGESAGPPERRLVEPCPCPSGRPRAGPFPRARIVSLETLRCPVCDDTGWAPKGWALAEVRRLRDLAVANGTAFFHKQWGGPLSRSGGRLLDGRTWDEYPEDGDAGG